MQPISRFLRREEGATAIEYGLIVALIAGVIVAALTTAGQSVSQTFDSMATAMTSASGST